MERRRVRGDFIKVCKCMKGYNKGYINKVLIVNEQGRTRSNGFKLDKFIFSKDIGKNWFTKRVVDEWNRLSSHVVSANSIDTFKKRLDRFMDGDGRWRWVVLGVLELPSVGRFVSCRLLCSYVLN